MATPTNLPASFSTGQVLTAANMNDIRGAFRILQVVFGSTNTNATNSTSTYADTGLTASITCQSTASKVLVIVDQNGCYKTAGNAENRIQIRVLRGATEIVNSGSLHLYTATAVINIGTYSVSVLDSPASTSALTYKTQFMNPNNTAQAQVQAGSAYSTITLLEVSA